MQVRATHRMDCVRAVLAGPVIVARRSVNSVGLDTIVRRIASVISIIRLPAMLSMENACANRIGEVRILDLLLVVVFKLISLNVMLPDDSNETGNLCDLYTKWQFLTFCT